MLNSFRTLRIDARGAHLDSSGNPHPPGTVLMAVDNHQFMIDLSKVHGTLVDPTIVLVTWGKQRDGVEMRDGGTIVRQDGGKQTFWDRELLRPYVDAWSLRRDELLAEQMAHEARKADEANRKAEETAEPA